MYLEFICGIISQQSGYLLYYFNNATILSKVYPYLIVSCSHTNILLYIQHGQFKERTGRALSY